MTLLSHPQDAGPGSEQTAVPPIRRRKNNAFDGLGDFVEFSAKVFREIPYAIRLYPSEIMRLTSAMVRENAAVILGLLFMMGAVMGLTASFLFSSIGIDSYVAAVNSVGGMRGIIQVVFGWVVAAKIGCGIVAELGAMRISEEIDAMDVMGVRSVPYLVSARVVAGAVSMPLLFITGLAVNFMAGYLFNVSLLNTVSGGGFSYFLFLFQNLRDFLIAMFWGTFLGTSIVLVACYFGFYVSGGPVGVGRATAKSMLVNLVMVSGIAMVLVQLFYGNSPNSPIGN